MVAEIILCALIGGGQPSFSALSTIKNAKSTNGSITLIRHEKAVVRLRFQEATFNSEQNSVHLRRVTGEAQLEKMKNRVLSFVLPEILIKPQDKAATVLGNLEIYLEQYSARCTSPVVKHAKEKWVINGACVLSAPDGSRGSCAHMVYDRGKATVSCEGGVDINYVP